MTAAEKKDQLKKAKSALKMIKKGQSISSVAKKFSVNSDNEESYTCLLYTSPSPRDCS